MKKGVRLATTIASLCLAVALMAFGVYAATSSTLSINSTVTFTSQDVQVFWEWSVAGGNLTTATDGEYQTTAEGTTDNKDVTLGTISFVTNSGDEGKTIKYTIKCTNTGAKSVAVTAPTAGLFAGDTNLDIVYTTNGTGTAWTDVTLDTDASKTVVYEVTLTLKDATKDIATQTLSASFVAGPVVTGGEETTD